MRIIIERRVTTYVKVCPYCKKRPIKKTTCGSWKCQWQHHIMYLRKTRKTDRIALSRRVI